MTAASSLTPSGSLCSEPSAKGTRTYSAWVPSMRWPKIHPMPVVPSPSRQCAGSCWWQYAQEPHELMHEMITRSPTARLSTAAPDLDDGADALVTEDAAVRHRWDVTLQDVQVGAADRGGVDLHDHIGRLLDGGVGHGLPRLLARSVVHERLHRFTPLSVTRASPGPLPEP